MLSYVDQKRVFPNSSRKNVFSVNSALDLHLPSACQAKPREASSSANRQKIGQKIALERPSEAMGGYKKVPKTANERSKTNKPYDLSWSFLSFLSFWSLGLAGSPLAGTVPRISHDFPLFDHFFPLFPHFVPLFPTFSSLCTTFSHFFLVVYRYVPLRTVTALF